MTKIEINLPITVNSIKLLPKIKNLFLDTEGVGGCTYSHPSPPSVFKGKWFNPKKEGIVAKKDFRNKKLVLKLLEEEVVKNIKNKPDCVCFNNKINNKNQLNERLREIGISKIKRILDVWRKSKIIEDDIVCIYGCYDIKHAAVEVKTLIGYIKELIETEADENLAWITYSSVCFPET